MKPVLYIVIPCYNEEKVLPITSGMFLEKLKSLISEAVISDDSRIMFVNDGSRDSTWDIITELSKEEKAYLKKLILNVRRKYIKVNYEYLNKKDINWESCADIESSTVFDTVLNKCVDELVYVEQYTRLKEVI